MSAFMRSIDTKLLGRKTYEMSLRMGAKFDSRIIVFSRHVPPADAPSGVEFVNGAIGPFVSRLREQPGKDIWLMGGGELIASFLDEQAIDEFVVSVAPVFIGDGIPLIARLSPPRAPGFAVRRTLRGWCGSTALPRSETFLMRNQIGVRPAISAILPDAQELNH